MLSAHKYFQEKFDESPLQSKYDLDYNFMPISTDISYMSNIYKGFKPKYSNDYHIDYYLIKINRIFQNNEQISKCFFGCTDMYFGAPFILDTSDDIEGALCIVPIFWFEFCYNISSIYCIHCIYGITTEIAKEWGRKFQLWVNLQVKKNSSESFITPAENAMLKSYDFVERLSHLAEMSTIYHEVFHLILGHNKRKDKYELDIPQYNSVINSWGGDQHKLKISLLYKSIINERVQRELQTDKCAYLFAYAHSTQKVKELPFEEFLLAFLLPFFYQVMVNKDDPQNHPSISDRIQNLIACSLQIAGDNNTKMALIRSIPIIEKRLNIIGKYFGKTFCFFSKMDMDYCRDL